jgi:hypothetical protein
VVACAIVMLSVSVLAGCGATTATMPPSATPVQAAPNPALVEFEGHIADATKREGPLVQALAKASTGSAAEMRLVAGQMVDWATAEISWLDAHRPDACYAAAANAYRSGVGSILTAASAFGTMATDPSPPTDAAGQAAGKGLSDGRTLLEAAATQAKSLRAACRP